MDFPLWPGRGRRPSEAEQNTGHGWVFPRPDGRTANCGGPGLCLECGNLAAHRAAYERRLWETVEPPLGRLTSAVVRANAVTAEFTAALNDVMLTLEPAPPTPPEIPLPVRDERAHSRACGIVPHGHGQRCHPNCPTCHGIEERFLDA